MMNKIQLIDCWKANDNWLANWLILFYSCKRILTSQKILEILWRISLNMFFWILLRIWNTFLIWILLKYQHKQALIKKLKLMGKALKYISANTFWQYWALWSPGPQYFSWKIYKILRTLTRPSPRHPPFMLNIRSLTSEVGLYEIL